MIFQSTACQACARRQRGTRLRAFALAEVWFNRKLFLLPCEQSTVPGLESVTLMFKLRSFTILYRGGC
eukprot:2890201-Pyramimonas_sp.AAC.1